MEIPGGEVAILPELIRGHPSPNGFDLTATCFGTVALDAMITGEQIAPGDALIGLPSSGLHSNSYSLARRATKDLPLDGAFGDGTLADALLEPTVIYVRAALDLLRSDIPVGRPRPHHRRRPAEPAAAQRAASASRSRTRCPSRRSSSSSRSAATSPRPRRGRSSTWAAASSPSCPSRPGRRGDALLATHHPGTRRIGTVTDAAGHVAVPSRGIGGDAAGLTARA